MFPVFLILALVLLALLALTRYQATVVLVAGLLPTYLLRLSVAGLPTTFLELAILATAVSGLLLPPIRRQWRSAWRSLPRPVLILVGLFVVAAIISTVISPHLRTSMGILKGWIATPLLFAWLVYSSTHYKLLTTHSIQRALILSGTVVSLFGISQFGQLDRIKSIYDVPNSLALFLAPVLVLAIWQSFAVGRNYSLPTTHYKLFAIVMSVALLGTQSVGGIGAVLLALLIGGILWLRGSQRRKLFLGVGTAAVAALIFLIIAGRTSYFLTPLFTAHSSPPTSLSVRLQLWSISWDLIKQHPLAGIGLGTFEPAYQQRLHERFRKFENCRSENSLKIENCLPSEALAKDGKLKIQTPPLAEFMYRDPHNWILSFWLNTGLLGLLSFAGLHAIVFKMALKQQEATANLPAGRSLARRMGEGRSFVIRHFASIGHSVNLRHSDFVIHHSAWLVIGILGALVSLLLFGLVDTIFWKNDLAVLQWILLALLIHASQQAAVRPAPA